MKIVIANWKMNPETLEDAKRIASRIEHGFLGYDRSKMEAAICPPFVFIPQLRHALHLVKLGAQNLSFEESGPFTGEVSAGQLKHFGVQYVIVGHSERRNQGEDDRLINVKLKIALKHNLHPILCVGYGTSKDTKITDEKKLLTKQLLGALDGVNFERGSLTVAYEPAWTISKGAGLAKPITPARAAEMIKFIKAQNENARVIYGASITSKNASQLAAYKEIEGGLVGGASLDPVEFLSIIRAFNN